MRTVFDQNLAELQRELLAMGVLVNRGISKSVEAFLTHDIELAQEVIEGDFRINDTEHMIDRKCQEIIAMQQPNAGDLRRIIAVLKASSNLERMGDHAENIAVITINIEDKKSDPELEALIKELAEIVAEMASDIIDAFVDFDVAAASEIAKRDVEVDKLYNNLRYTSVNSMIDNPDAVYVASDYSFIGMHLERIGDYVTNIAEAIVYLDSGSVVDLNRR